MRILLDTHVLLWWLMDDPHLPGAFQVAIADADNEVFVSAVTHAEIAIKRSLGKLDAPWIPDELLADNGIIGMSFTSSHATRMLDLPFHHRDPFDRMLIAQVALEDVAFATVDPRCRQYDIRLLDPA